MLTMILYALLAWFLYNLVFRFIVPIYKATRQMKQKFREMQGHMQDANEPNGFRNEAPPKPGPSSKAPRKDYIDFEEIK